MKGITKIFKFKLYGRLNDFIKSQNGNSTFREVYFQDKPSLKDIFESQGIPHTEIGYLTVNGRKGSLEEPTLNNHYVEVWPSDLSKLSWDIWNTRPAFILDVHLGTLTRRMRLLGIDTAYDNSFSDAEIIKYAEEQGRAVLTRDLGILKNNRVRVGYWVRAEQPDAKLDEVLQEFGIAEFMESLTRCLACNGLLKPVAKEDVIEKLPERVAHTYNEFHRCNSCGNLYWKGSHYKELIDYVDNIRRQYLRY